MSDPTLKEMFTELIAISAESMLKNMPMNLLFVLILENIAPKTDLI